MSSTYHLLDTVQIPRGMVWADEHNWVEAESATEYSITGALLVDSGVRLAGRPITLQAEDDSGWIRRDALLSVRALAAVPGAQYTLALADGRSFTVMFAPGDPISAHAIARPEIPTDRHPYVATVRLIQV